MTEPLGPRRRMVHPAVVLILLVVATTLPLSLQAATTFSLNKSVYSPGESIVANVAGIQSPSATHWVGIWSYPDNGLRQGPWNQVHNGGAGSITWQYVGNVSSGSLAFNSANLPHGRHVAFLLANDQYTWLADPVFFAVAPSSTPPSEPGFLITGKATYSTAETIRFQYGDISPSPTNWIGIWRYLDGPGADGQNQSDGPWAFSQTNASTAWRYTPASAGETDFSLAGFPPGKYAAFLLANDQYTWLSLPVFFNVSSTENPSHIRLMQFNIWQEGTSVSGGYDGIIDTVVQTNSDVITMSEVRNYNNQNLHSRVLSSLQSRGLQYHSFKSGNDTAIISRYPIISSATLGSFSKAIIAVNGVEIAVYAGHLDYTHYACYLPRGYGGGATAPTPTYQYGWNEIPSGPIVDVDLILQVNDASGRPGAIAQFVNDALIERQNGRIVIMAGDFNEPSHLDWTAATAELFDHNGSIVPWTSTTLLDDAGYLDAYRVLHPNPVTHPGFTWPSDNAQKSPSQLTWAPNADERDRIDFVFYHPDPRLVVDEGIVIGPSTSIVRNQRVEENSQDTFFTPDAVWPSDHKGVLVTFGISPP